MNCNRARTFVWQVLKLRYQYLLLLAFLVMLLLQVNICTASDKPNIDSLFATINNANSDNEKVHAAALVFTYLSGTYRNPILLDSVYNFLQQKNYPLNNQQDSVARAEALQIFGEYHYIKRNFEASIDYYLQAIEFWRKLRNDGAVVNLYNMIAAGYYQNNYTKAAIEYLYKIINFSESNDDSTMSGGAYFNLGLYLMYDGQPAKAIEAFYESNKVIPNPLIAYSYISECYLKLNRMDSALVYLTKSSPLEFSNAVYHPPYFFRAKAAYFNATGNADSAIYFYNRAIDGFKKAMQQHHLPDCYYQLGNIYKLRNSRKEAIALFNESIVTAKEYHKYKTLVKALRSLSGIYNQQSDFADAAHCLQTAFAYDDSVKVDEVNDMIASQNLKLETVRQNEAIQSLRIKKDLEKQQLIQEQKWINYSTASAIALISLVSILLWRSWSTTRKSNRDLKNALTELHHAQEQLIQQEKLASLGSLTAGIAHEIKNPLNFVNNFSILSVDLLNEFLESKDENDRNEIAHDLKKNLEKICEHGMRADSIVRNMLQHSRTSTGDKQLINLNKLCEEYLNLAYHGKRASDPDFNCMMEFKPDKNLPNLKLDAQDISRVILNVVTNAMDEIANKPDGKVVVSTVKNGSFVYVNIKDNGNGIPDEIRQKIFEPFFTTKPTGKGTGLGLSLSNEILKAHGGSISVNDKIQDGTEFRIALPM